MGEFLEMSGYALFVWPAYGATVLVLVLLLADSLGRLRRRQSELRRLEESE
jgi:heme exporter protein CcmD